MVGKLAGVFVRRAFAVLVSLGLLSLASISLAGLAPENVAVVVNGDSWASMTVANEYQRLRGIPACNVIVLSGLTSVETTDVDHFRKEILTPVFGAIAARGLTKQIDCITYSVDIPYAVNVTSDMGSKKFPMVITGMASTNGLTYLHEWVERKDTEYLRLDINRYNRRTLPLPRGASLTEAETADMARGLDLYQQKKYAESAEVLKKLLDVGRSDPDIAYDLACSLALAGKATEAISALKTAVESGWRNSVQTSSDPDLKSLQGRSEFVQLIDKMKSMPLKVQEGFGFRSQRAWGRDGTPGASGPHYMLSTMLGVTCGRANSVNEVLASLARSATADGTSPTGSIYFPQNGDVRSTTRAWAFNAAANTLKQLGLNAVVENGILPVKRADVAGAMIGTAGFDWNASGSTVLPGAIIEHLTSFGAVLSERSDQTPCTDFIRAGASGTSGTVTEPYALQQKFPTAFMHVMYCRGWTLAESYYQSLFGPYQLLVIGDPLCKPWAKSAKLSLGGITSGQVVKGHVDLKPKVVGGTPGSVASYEIFVDGKLVGSNLPGSSLRFDSTSVEDGTHLVSVVAIHVGPQELRSRASTWIQVRNHTKAILSAVPSEDRLSLGIPAMVLVKCPNAKSIELRHFGRVVGKLSGDNGWIEIPGKNLGLGRVSLESMAHTAAGVILGAPVVLKVEEFDIVGKSDLTVTFEKVVPGLTISFGGGPAMRVKDTIDPAWLSSLAKGPSQHFVMTGTFETAKKDLYQVQLRTNTGAAVVIDGQRVVGSTDESQMFAPATVIPGRHKLQIIGIASPGAFMDIRMGVNGVQHLAEGQFRHSVP